MRLFQATAAATPAPTPTPSPVSTSPADLADELASEFQNAFSLGFTNTLILAAIVAVITFVVIKVIKHFLRDKMQGNTRIFYHLIQIIILIIAASIVLMTIDPLKEIGTTILASSGFAGMVVGLAGQQALGNLFSGISISVSKPFLVGEYIEILNFNPPVAGIVKEIGLRHTTILDTSNKTIVVPNSIIDQEILRTIHTLEGDSVCTYLFVGISYDSDLEKAIQIMSETCAAHPNTLDTRTHKDKDNGIPKVVVYVTDMLDSTIQLRASVWAKDTSTGYATLSDLRQSVKKAFAENGIDIPYPYRNIVIKNKDS